MVAIVVIITLWCRKLRKNVLEMTSIAVAAHNLKPCWTAKSWNKNQYLLLDHPKTAQWLQQNIWLNLRTKFTITCFTKYLVYSHVTSINNFSSDSFYSCSSSFYYCSCSLPFVSCLQSALPQPPHPSLQIIQSVCLMTMFSSPHQCRPHPKHVGYLCLAHHEKHSSLPCHFSNTQLKLNSMSLGSLGASKFNIIKGLVYLKYFEFTITTLYIRIKIVWNLRSRSML